MDYDGTKPADGYGKLKHFFQLRELADESGALGRRLHRLIDEHFVEVHFDEDGMVVMLGDLVNMVKIRSRYWEAVYNLIAAFVTMALEKGIERDRLKWTEYKGGNDG